MTQAALTLINPTPDEPAQVVAEESTLTASLTIDRLRPQFARVEGATCSCSFQRQLNTESAAALKL